MHLSESSIQQIQFADFVHRTSLEKQIKELTKELKEKKVTIKEELQKASQFQFINFKNKNKNKKLRKYG